MDVNKHVMALRRKHLQCNAAKIQAEHSREQNKLSLTFKKVPKGAVSLVNGNTHKDAL